MIRASVYGRLGADPVERKTKNGDVMATANLAVQAGRDHDQTQWFNLIAFGKTGEALMRHAKGDLLGAMGPLYKSRYTSNGEEREGWSLTCESIVSAQTVRPGGGKKKNPESAPAPADEPADEPADAETPFDDPMPDWG